MVFRRCGVIFALALLASAPTASTAAFNYAEQPQRQQQQQVVNTNTPRDTTTWQATFSPARLEVTMKTAAQVLLEITNVDTTQANYLFRLQSEHPHLAVVNHEIPANEIDPTTGAWSGNITIDTLFLGITRIRVERVNTLFNTSETNDNYMEVIITRRQRVIDHVFTGSVALLVSLLYINFGAALDLTVLRSIVVRPVGPLIGFLSQFILMPVLSFGLGYLIFPDSVELQLGLFFTGVSPSGGASNIWAVILGGNINLSVLMTSISNIAAFGMMPLWLFTLGNVIFERGNMKVPYTNIATFAVCLIVPLGIGVAIQKCSPRLTRILVRLLKPISTALILFIIVFAIVTNLYLFELFSWQIAVAGLALPWLGYVFAWFFAKGLRQNSVDALTIAIETGIQNTGIAIFLLRFSLPQPQADLTTVIPVAVAIMTPLPLLCLYIYKRITGRNIKDGVVDDQYTGVE